jgi:hypothetical protein
MPSEGPRKLFISYRREDGEGWAGRLAEKFQQAFGASTVFYDYDSIEPSSNWRNVVESALSECKLLVAVMGPRWVNATAANGDRRLDDPEDLVRFELATALERQIPILPVLVGKASLPRPADLPKELEALLNHQAVELSSQYWRREMGFLLTTAEKVIGARRKRRPSRGTSVNVGEELALDNAEAGSIIGIRGLMAGAVPTQTIVAKRASIRGVKMQDIVGIELTGKRNDRHAGSNSSKKTG